MCSHMGLTASRWRGKEQAQGQAVIYNVPRQDENVPRQDESQPNEVRDIARNGRGNRNGRGQRAEQLSSNYKEAGLESDRTQRQSQSRNQEEPRPKSGQSHGQNHQEPGNSG